MKKISTLRLAGLTLALALGGTAQLVQAQTVDYSQPNYPETATSPSEMQTPSDYPSPRGMEDTTLGTEPRGAQGPMGTSSTMDTARTDMPSTADDPSMMPTSQRGTYDRRFQQVQPNWAEQTWYMDAQDRNRQGMRYRRER